MIKNINEFSELEEYVKDGYISKRGHPTAPLDIYNYTHKTQFDGFWNEVTEQCRGLIVDRNTGSIVSRPFRKFFGLEKYGSLTNLPKEPFIAYDKQDGSLAVSYWVDGKVRIATRGSFTSPQAIKANEMLDRYYSDTKFCPELTYLFEIIYPENKIVVNYGDKEELVLLACIYTETGNELPDLKLLNVAGFHHDFPIVQSFSGIDRLGRVAKYIKDNPENTEGLVLRFESGLRVKVKTEEYMRLHRLITNCSNYTIWEHMSQDKSLNELMERVPDEFYKWIKKTKDELLLKFITIEATALRKFEEIRMIESRKDFALEACKTECRSILFLMRDGKSYREYIWDNIKENMTYERPSIVSNIEE